MIRHTGSLRHLRLISELLVSKTLHDLSPKESNPLFTVPTAQVDINDTWIVAKSECTEDWS